MLQTDAAASPAIVGSARQRHLDGLRGVAVASVVIYHFGGGSTSWLRGGFLGVDMFFVLSGYLITGLLLGEVDGTGRVRLIAFWGRRLRRLLPALATCLLAVSFAVWWAAPPETWPARRADLMTSLIYVANWHFIGVSQDYFAGYSGASPVRHMWSLAVEEQFYIVWPIVLWALVALGRRTQRTMTTHPGVVGGVVACLALASAIAMAVQSQTDSPLRAYYGSDGRAQELLVGALLALLLRSPSCRAQRAATLLARPLWCWSALLAVALVLGRDTWSAYYRGGALVFSLVVAGVIAGTNARTEHAVTRLLASPLLAGLGRISYGVYLWHWPVLLLLPPGHPGLVGHIGTPVAQSLITLLLALASYHWIERPVIEGRALLIRRHGGRTVAAAALCSALVGSAVMTATALPTGISEGLADRADTPCPGESISQLTSCVVTQGLAGAPVTMLVGDSTARALTPGLAAEAAKDGRTLVQAAWKRCTPTRLVIVPNGMAAPDAPARSCTAHARTAILEALRIYHPQIVIVSDFGSHHQALRVNGMLLRPATAAHDQAIRAGYLDLTGVLTAHGARTILLELPPPGESLGPSVAAGRPAGQLTPSYGGQFVSGFNAVLQQVADLDPRHVSVVSLDDVLCPGGHCAAVQDGHVVRSDGVHVTAATSRRIAPVLVQRVNAALAAQQAG